MVLYELIILGSPTPKQRAALQVNMATAASEFGLLFPVEFAVLDAADVTGREPKACSVGVYFAGNPTVDAAVVDALEFQKVPIIPAAMVSTSLLATVPAAILQTNACLLDPADTALEALSAAILEALGLLREQRRIFLSYRRIETREVAVQLHDELSSRGFDVFLDTHDIMVGRKFQEMLWHKMADADIVIMLDSKGYFDSKWTRQEFGKALARGIHILRLIWPDNTAPPRTLELADPLHLVDADLNSGRLIDTKLADITARAERLRSRSIATRHRQLAGKLVAEVERIGGHFDGIGAHRAMSLTLPFGRRVWAYPAVGVPTADLLHDVHEKAAAAEKGLANGSDAAPIPCVVYDEIGIRPAWLQHLVWLNEHIKVVRSLKVLNAAGELVEWDL